MKTPVAIKSIVFGAVAALTPTVYAAQDPLPFVSPIFGEHMVLQRDKPNPVWGWTAPGDRVTVEFAAQRKSARADAGGKWRVVLDPMPASAEPQVLQVSNFKSQVSFADVLVGDVWLCGGQSNMEMGMGMARDAEREIAAGDHPNIRLCRVEKTVAYAEAAVPDAAWSVCSPQALGSGGWEGFSAVGYYFGRALQRDLNIPIGLVQNCWGGTPAESWTSPEALRRLGGFDASLDQIARLEKTEGPRYGNFIEHWHDEHDVGQREHWFAPDWDDRGWKLVDLKEGFRALGVGDTPAVCYFRKTIVLPDPPPPGPATIQLGEVERMDTVFINGQWVGGSAWVEDPRKYGVNPGVLHAGTNVVVVRIFKTLADGGFRADSADLQLTLGDGTRVPLHAGWKGQVSVKVGGPVPLPTGFENWPTMPSVLHHGMLAPTAPLSITGAIWYQGESNVGRAEQYRELLPAMIADWRRDFDQGDFPFYIVSLAAFMDWRDQPGDDAWAELREAQDLAARSVTNSGLAVTIDVGEAHDIHPRNKQPVGERLALLALANHYGKKVPCSGPRFASMEPLDGALRLRFMDTDGGLVAKGGKLEEFSIRGADGKWVWAEARIEGETIVVSSAAVPRPVAVRYAWQANPKATLFNGAGLPAIPFRSDGPARK